MVDKLRARAVALEQAVGYQLTDWAVVSFGVNRHRLSVRSRFRESDSANEWYEDRRHLSLFGANVSACLVPHAKRGGMYLCYEEGVQHLQRTFDSSQVRNIAVGALSLGFSIKF